jgi:hypothetical protein
MNQISGSGMLWTTTDLDLMAKAVVYHSYDLLATRFNLRGLCDLQAR